MRVFRALRAVGLAGLLAMSTYASTPQVGRRPDVFLITIDTLRADHVRCYGYERVETPALDGLARDGIRFAQAFTPSPITNTSHASILTGLLPASHGVTDFALPLSTAHPTMAALLGQQGYHTAAFIGAVILDSRTLAPGFDRGFDFYDDFPQHPTTTSRWGRLERRGMDVVKRAKIWLGQHPAGPHFMWLHLYDPHDPYEPPAPYSQKYKDHLYDGEIAYADSALADFIAYLKTTGRYENSLIVVVGDHGEGLGDHHEDTHGIFLYDSTTHVPLIIKQPRELTGGTVVNAQVMTVDILSTVLEMVGAAAPAKTDGESLTPYLAGTNQSERPALGETDYPLRFGWAPLQSVRIGGFKYIEAPRPEFYDLRVDAAELDNRYQPWNQDVQTVRAQLAELRAKQPAPQVSKGVVSAGTINELKALGYLSPADAGSATSVPEPSLLPDPKDKIEQHNLLHAAMVAAQANRDAEARKSLERVLILEPTSTVALRQLGELELRAGDYHLAAQHLKVAAEARPDDATPLLQEGQALAKLHNPAAARDALEASLRLLPEQLPARVLLGEVYLSLGNPIEAEDEFEAALLLEPNSKEAKLGLAKVEIAHGDFAQAARQLEQLSRSEAKNPEVFEALAKVYAAMGRAAKAQQAKLRAKLLQERTARPSSH